jgi:hypothetical protein
MYGRTYVCTHAGRYRNVCVCARTTADTGQRVSELGSSASAQSVVGADTVAEHPGIEAMHQAPASLIACNNIEARHHARRRRSQPADEAAQAPRHPSRGRVEASNARVARAHARTHAQNPRKHARGGAGGWRGRRTDCSCVRQLAALVPAAELMYEVIVAWSTVSLVPRKQSSHSTVDMMYLPDPPHTTTKPITAPSY